MRVASTLTVLLTLVTASGCGSFEQNAALGVAGGTAVLARTPSHDIEQVYYVGIFDPAEQVPPSLYRITVRGQASFISATSFASGWVPAGLIDSLGTRLRLDESGVSIKGTDDIPEAKLATGRGLMMFGPEGFRVAPRDHRLVIVMGSDPSEYFQAIDETLGEIATAKRLSESTISAANDQLIRAMLDHSRRRERITAAQAAAARDLGEDE